MGSPPLSSALLRYLRGVQRQTGVGLRALVHASSDRSVRTVYRWRRDLGEQLLVIPSVRVEYLGLLHAHVFVHEPSDAWLSCRYGVEAAFVTADLTTHFLYVHCLVPVLQQRAAITYFESLGSARWEVLWSGSCWQEFVHPDEALSMPSSATLMADSELLRAYPLVVPVMMESWRYPNSMPMIWERVKQRLAHRDLRAHLPHRRVHVINGKTHVKRAFDLLSAQGLLAQHVVRCHPLLNGSVKLFVRINGDRVTTLRLLTGLRRFLHAIETYPTVDGYFCRLLGHYDLLYALMHLPEEDRSLLRVVCVHTKRYPAPTMHFAYHDLFDPRSGTWRLPEEA